MTALLPAGWVIYATAGLGLLAGLILANAAKRRARRAGRLVAGLLDLFDGPAWLVDRDGTVRDANHAARALVLVNGGAVFGDTRAPLVPRERLFPALSRAQDGTPTTLELSEVEGHLSVAWLPGAAGAGKEPAALVRLIAGRSGRELERERSLARSLRLELVGQLASGIAHHFTNLLTSILGFTELVLRELPKEAPEHKDLEEVRRAGLRGAELSQHLLSFSHQTLELVEREARAGEAPGTRQTDSGSGRFTIDIVPIVDGLARLLRPCLGRTIEIGIRHARTSQWIVGRVTAIENLIVHLVLTVARAVDGRRGSLMLSTQASEADSARVLLVAEWKASTEAGDAPADAPVSWLSSAGLDALRQTVHEVGGELEVREGRPSALSVLLPRASAATQGAVTPPGPKGTAPAETILWVEDEPLVRRLVSTGLREAGYRVIEASSPAGALAVAEGWGGGVDLLLCNLVLPNGSGIEIAERLRERCANLRVLFVSGDSPRPPASALAGAGFLAKPFTTVVLLARVRAVLADVPGDVARGPA